jgi:predicted nucleic acid-binding protein
MFAKIDAIDILIELFKNKVALTPKIRDELSTPLEYGYAYPLNVFTKIRTIPLSDEVIAEYEKLQKLGLGKGELEAIAFCKTRKCIFVTNDKKAREVAKKNGILVLSLQAVLKAIWKKKIKNKNEVKQILERIKDVDNLSISLEVEKEIFED